MVTYFNEIHYYLSLLASMSSIKGNNHERIAMASGSNRTVGIKAEVLNDLASRFLINLSTEEKEDPIKLCTHIELAHWYYLDLMRPEDATLPGCNLREFMATVFRHCPWLIGDSTAKDLDKLISQWKSHKFRKPVRGAIILNKGLTKCLLVQGYPSCNSWGFPKGKLEEGEADDDAAVREVYEETGFDIRRLIQKEDFLEAIINDSNARMYIIPGVPDNTEFKPKTRNEIRHIQWFNIKDLPTYKKDQGSRQALGKTANNFFMIIPFIGRLRKWIQKKKKSKVCAVSATFKQTQGQLHTTHQNGAEFSPLVLRSKTAPIVYSSPHPSRGHAHPLVSSQGYPPNVNYQSPVRHSLTSSHPVPTHRHSLTTSHPIPTHHHSLTTSYPIPTHRHSLTTSHPVPTHRHSLTSPLTHPSNHQAPVSLTPIHPAHSSGGYAYHQNVPHLANIGGIQGSPMQHLQSHFPLPHSNVRKFLFSRHGDMPKTGLKISLKPSESMAKFKFDREAILTK